MVGLGVDVGGTNTDVILTGLADGGTLVHELPTAREDESRATVLGTLEICEMAGIAPHVDPLERDPALVFDNFLDELISLEQARGIYGVVIDERRLDEKATQALRERLRREKSDGG